MPQLTANPSVGDTVTDSGWQYRWTGDRWVSDGFTQQFNPFAGFTGPFMPAITDPTAITVASVGNGIAEGPWTRGGTDETALYGDTTLTQGAWITYRAISTPTNPTAATGEAIVFVAPWVGGNTFWEGLSSRFFQTSQIDNSGFYSAFNAYATDSAYDMTNDVITATTTNRRFVATDQINTRDSANALNAQFIQLGTNQFDTNSNALLVDQFIVTISETEGSSFINNDYRGNTYEFRRGELITQGFWQDPSPAVGTTTRPTSGSRYIEVNVYPLYTRVTTP